MWKLATFAGFTIASAAVVKTIRQGGGQVTLSRIPEGKHGPGYEITIRTPLDLRWDRPSAVDSAISASLQASLSEVVDSSNSSSLSLSQGDVSGKASNPRIISSAGAYTYYFGCVSESSLFHLDAETGLYLALRAAALEARSNNPRRTRIVTTAAENRDVLKVR